MLNLNCDFVFLLAKLYCVLDNLKQYIFVDPKVSAH